MQKGIELAFNKVIDLTEIEIVETLRVVLANHRHIPQSTSVPSSDVVNAMQVDSEPPIPTSQMTSTHESTCPALVSFLHLVTTYPMSRVPLLLSLLRYMQDPEDVTILLGILSDWIGKISKAEMDMGQSRKLIPGKKDLKKTKEGVWVVVGRKSEKAGSAEGKIKKTEELPPLEKVSCVHRLFRFPSALIIRFVVFNSKIINFTQTLLDSSFLRLLSHKPSHIILRKLSSQLTPEIAFVDAAQDLRGALEPFAIAQEKGVKESLVPKEEREKEKQKLDWRQRKKGVGILGGAGADVGLYNLEELVL